MPTLRSLLTVFPAAIALLAAPAIAAPAAKPAPAAATDWNRVVTQTPGGAFLLGNPAAKTRLVEYFSYTCSHCAAFMAEGMGPLRTGWIRRGLAALEFRNAVRDPYDMTAALLARCGGKARFVSNHEALFSNFQAWLPQLQAFADARDPNAPPPADRAAAMVEIADKTGLTALLAKRGLTPATQKACLSNAAQTRAILDMTKDAWEVRKISGTPFFLIGGKPLDAHDWAGVKAALPALPGTAN